MLHSTQLTRFRFNVNGPIHRRRTNSIGVLSEKLIIVRLIIKIHNTQRQNQKKPKIQRQPSSLPFPNISSQFSFFPNLSSFYSNSNVPDGIPSRVHEDCVSHSFQPRFLGCSLAPITHPLAQFGKLYRRLLGDLVLFQTVFETPLEIDDMLLFHLRILPRV